MPEVFSSQSPRFLLPSCSGRRYPHRMSGSHNEWPAHLDAVIAAPKHHRVLLENEQVRVLETVIHPGETVPLHTHCWASVYYLLSVGDFVRRDSNGNVTLDSREHPHKSTQGDAVWAPPIGPHTLENVGRTVIRIISTEVKSPRCPSDATTQVASSTHRSIRK